ncbi:MAG: TRAP transporter small permease [Desulfobacteraceae bacterium]|nr:MAG: TRAP transporter small permease [Desulfobacteraceae bacterium]
MEKIRMNVVNRISSTLLIIGMAALIIMMLFVCLDIVARYAFSQPIAGSSELVSVLLVVSCFFTFPLCQIHKRNITIPIFIDLLGARKRAYVDVVLAVLNSAFTFVIVWETCRQGIEELNSHAVSPIMGIPLGWFKIGAAAAMLFLLLAFLSDLIGVFQKQRTEGFKEQPVT